MNIRLIAVLLILVCTLAAGQENEKEIKIVLDNQVKAWNNGDIDEFMKGYWNSDETSFVSGGSLTKGYNEVLARYKKGYATREAMGTLKFEDLKIRVYSPVGAVVTGVFRLKRSADNPWGRFTLIFEKKTAGWRIIYDHTSSATP